MTRTLFALLTHSHTHRHTQVHFCVSVTHILFCANQTKVALQETSAVRTNLIRSIGFRRLTSGSSPAET